MRLPPAVATTLDWDSDRSRNGTAEAPLPPVPAGPCARANLLLRPSAPGAGGVYLACPDLIVDRVGSPALLLFVIPTQAPAFFPPLPTPIAPPPLSGSPFFFASPFPSP